MLSSTGPIDPSGRILPSVPSQNMQLPALAAPAGATPAIGGSANSTTFPADVVQVSSGARTANQAAGQTAGSSQSGTAQQAGSGGVPDVARVAETIADLQKKTTSVTFDLSDDPGHVVVKIVNNATGEVVRQIPSAEMVELAKRQEALRGMLVQKTS